MARCVYCDCERPLTREHVWSNVLLRLFDAEAPLTFDPHRERVYGADPVIRDVCADCNNGSLSSTDAAAGEFTRRYLLNPIPPGTQLDLHDVPLLRWVVKTAANMERAARADRQWWRRYIAFILGRDGIPDDLDFLFAPWQDLSGANFLERLNIVHKLDARGLDWRCLQAIEPAAVERQVEAGWALKVANGVLAAVAWRPGFDRGLRDLLLREVRGYGWLISGVDATIGRPPFNRYTCVMFNAPCPLDLVPYGGKLRKLSDARATSAAEADAWAKSDASDESSSPLGGGGTP